MTDTLRAALIFPVGFVALVILVFASVRLARWSLVNAFAWLTMRPGVPAAARASQGASEPGRVAPNEEFGNAVPPLPREKASAHGEEIDDPPNAR